MSGYEMVVRFFAGPLMLHGVEVVVEALLGEEGDMTPLFDDPTVLDNDDSIGIFDS